MFYSRQRIFWYFLRYVYGLNSEYDDHLNHDIHYDHDDHDDHEDHLNHDDIVDHEDSGNHDDHDDHCICKKVGGYLTRCARSAASIVEIDNQYSVSQSVSQSVSPLDMKV